MAVANASAPPPGGERGATCGHLVVDRVLPWLRVSDVEVTEVNMSFCGITAAAAEALADALQGNTVVTTVHLNRNPLLGNWGAGAFADLLRRGKSTIVTLSLADCSIGDRGAMMLGGALAVNNATAMLRELVLHGNPIGAEGAKSIACGLMANTTLEAIDLDGCQVGDRGCTSIADALRTNHSLKRLELSRNSITDVGASALFVALLTNGVVGTIQLSGSVAGDVFDNTISDGHLAAIQRAVQSNRQKPAPVVVT